MEEKKKKTINNNNNNKLFFFCLERGGEGRDVRVGTVCVCDGNRNKALRYLTAQ